MQVSLSGQVSLVGLVGGWACPDKAGEGQAGLARQAGTNKVTQEARSERARERWERFEA